jgi:hypothetical protein
MAGEKDMDKQLAKEAYDLGISVGKGEESPTFEQWWDYLEYQQSQLEEMVQPKTIPCPSCYGEGTWETECCSGAGGCSCKGQPVDMGACNVCHGTGYVDENNHNARANSDYIMSRGACFAGSGPTSGFWAGKPALNRPSRY